MSWRRDDQVMIECVGRRVPGVIMLASPNGKSLMLSFEAILDGHVGMMPVLEIDSVYRSVATGCEVTINPRR